MKIFIVGTEDMIDLSSEIVSLYDDLNICKTFISKTSDSVLKKYTFELNNEDIILSFKNNALLFIEYIDEYITGITLDDFIMSDIIPLQIKHFNDIINDYLLEDDVLIVWLDHKISNPSNNEIIEVKYLQDRIDDLSLKTLYFCDENIKDIAQIIVDYILGDEATREEILEENS